MNKEQYRRIEKAVAVQKEEVKYWREGVENILTGQAKARFEGYVKARDHYDHLREALYMEGEKLLRQTEDSY